MTIHLGDVAWVELLSGLASHGNQPVSRRQRAEAEEGHDAKILGLVVGFKLRPQRTRVRRCVCVCVCM